MIKRLFDIFAATLGLAIFAPLLIAIAIWIRLDAGRGVFFRQERVGRFGSRFRIHKFRTMVSDAPARGLAVTSARDSRVTRSGELLRGYKLDELPQLIDVLKGDMSMVGPRPEVPEFVDLYPAAVREEILSVRPGITDDTSLLFRRENELLADAADARQTYIEEIMPVKLRSYVAYVRTRSFWGDMRILGRTLVALLRD